MYLLKALYFGIDRDMVKFVGSCRAPLFSASSADLPNFSFKAGAECANNLGAQNINLLITICQSSYYYKYLITLTCNTNYNTNLKTIDHQPNFRIHRSFSYIL